MLCLIFSLSTYIGVSNTLGRFAAGFLAYLGLGSVRIYTIGTGLAGVACFFLPVCTTYIELVVQASSYGFFLGEFISTVVFREIGQNQRDYKQTRGGTKVGHSLSDK